MPSFNCEECGRPSSSSRKTAKRCSLCRLLNNLMFIGIKTRKCLMCKEVFAPISRDDSFCGQHAIAIRKHGTTEACTYCGKEGACIHENVNVCITCARTVRLRSKFLNALKRKIETGA